MKDLRTFEELSGLGAPVYMAIGVFDGVHLGHQRVIMQAREDAKKAGGVSVVLTFDPHPIRVLRPKEAPPLLTSTTHKLGLIDALGIDACLVLTFDQTLADTSAEEFVKHMAAKQNHVREICVGSRFRFGHNRSGDVRLLEKLSSKFGFALKEIKSVETKTGEMISSTAVRQHVLAGNFEQAAAMLGRPFSILGLVQHGEQIGRKLGFPTANVNPQNEVLPPNGVYAAHAWVCGKTRGSVVNIGVRPTFEGRKPERILEAHIFDLNEDFYGTDIEISFVKKLRDEKKFDSSELLKVQIAKDAQAARKLLAS